MSARVLATNRCVVCDKPMEDGRKQCPECCGLEGHLERYARSDVGRHRLLRLLPTVEQVGHRMSALNVAQYCAKGPALGAPYGGESARLSSAFHAKAVGDLSRYLMLTDEERAEVDTWKEPEDHDLGQGIVLRYADAEKELAVGLTAELGYCDYDDTARRVTRGHLDLAWVVEINGMRVAYVPDMKRSEWTVLDGPEAPQVHAYGMSYADKMWCDAYVPGIWSVTEGRYWWGELVMLGSERHKKIGERIIAIARNLPTNDNQYTTGAHCTGCYGRLHCPAYVLPPERVGSSLETLVTGDLTPEAAANILVLSKRAIDTAEAAIKTVQEAVARGMQIRDGESGMVYGRVECRGRAAISKESLQAAGINPEDHMRRGAPYFQHRWVKP